MNINRVAIVIAFKLSILTNIVFSQVTTELKGDNNTLNNKVVLKYDTIYSYDGLNYKRVFKKNSKFYLEVLDTNNVVIEISTISLGIATDSIHIYDGFGNYKFIVKTKLMEFNDGYRYTFKEDDIYVQKYLYENAIGKLKIIHRRKNKSIYDYLK